MINHKRVVSWYMVVVGGATAGYAKQLTPSSICTKRSHNNNVRLTKSLIYILAAGRLLKLWRADFTES